MNYKNKVLVCESLSKVRIVKKTRNELGYGLCLDWSYGGVHYRASLRGDEFPRGKCFPWNSGLSVEVRKEFCDDEPNEDSDNKTKVKYESSRKKRARL